MTNQDELKAITQTRGTCPICAEDGKTFTRQLHGLASHLMKEHTVDQLVYEIAGESVLAAMDENEQPKFAEGGLVTGPGGLVGGGGCVIRFDPRVERVFTAEDMRSPEAQAVLEKLNQEVRARPSAGEGPVTAEMVRASNPSPAIDAQAVADAVNAEIKRQGRVR